MKKLREEIERTLQQERKNLEAYDPTNGDPMMDNCKGWVEALEYTLNQIDLRLHSSEHMLIFTEVKEDE
mgnify:FL=1